LGRALSKVKIFGSYSLSHARKNREHYISGRVGRAQCKVFYGSKASWIRTSNFKTLIWMI